MPYELEQLRGETKEFLADLTERDQRMIFAVVTLGTPAAKMAKVVREAMNDSRREFNISLSRRGSFTVAIASAEWGETASWDMMLSLAQQRL